MNRHLRLGMTRAVPHMPGLSDAERKMYESIVLPLTNGKLRCTVRFYRVEMELWKEGRAGYLSMLGRMMTAKLDAAGAFGPYSFFSDTTVGDGNVTPFSIIAEEL
jgi:hypothetical protein